MATKQTVWIAGDGGQYDTREEAETHELVCDVADLIKKAAKEHDTDIDYHQAYAAADILINTNVFAILRSFLKNRL